MIKAVIFDMDGVVSDTQGFHGEIESMLLKEYGIEMAPREISNTYAGVTDEKMFAEIFDKHGVAVGSIPALLKKKWEFMRQVSKGKLTAIPHAIALIHELHANGFRLAIASASTKAFIDEVVDELAIRKYFDAIVSTYDVEHGKPAPDIFLFAAKKLGVMPEEAIVIEDGRSGMIGAAAAHMHSIGLVEDTSKDYPATKLVSSLKDVNIELIQSL